MNPWSGQSNSVAFSTVFDAKFWVKATLASRPDGGFRHPRHPGMQQYVWLLVPQTGTNCPKFGHLLMDYKPIHRAVHRIPKHCFDLCCSGVLLHVFQNKSMYEFFGDIFYSLNIAILAPFGLDSTLSYITSYASMKEMKKLCTDLSFKELSGMTILWLCQNCQLFTWKSMILVSCITLMIKVTR